MSKRKRHHSQNVNKNNNNMENQEKENINTQEQPQTDQTTENNTDNTTEQDKKAEEQTAENADQKTQQPTQENNEENDIQKKYDELNDKYIRLYAEYDNYRRRTLKEKMDLVKTGGEDVLKNILPVVDNMERAMKSMETATDMEAVKEGITLIYNKFKEFLTKSGLKEIEAINLPLNTDVHEAVTKFPAPTEEQKGKIIDVIEKGYYLHDKVVRFAKVVVGE